MKIYKISQEVNNNYDTYDAAIVAAENEDHPQYQSMIKRGDAK